MPLIEELPNSSSISAPGWTYVIDTGYDPSKAAFQPSGARKRNARIAGLSGGDTSVKQNAAILKRLADLERDNLKDAQITIPSKQKDAAGRASKGKTPTTRKILMAQKTFANYLDDEEAMAKLEQSSAGPVKGRPLSQVQRASSAQTKADPLGTQGASSTSLLGPGLDPSAPSQAPLFRLQAEEDARLLQSTVPLKPSDELMEALVSAPPLSYAAAAAAPSSSGRPPRFFCELCGYWGKIRCLQCGARVCGLECKLLHDEDRCQKYPG